MKKLICISVAAGMLFGCSMPAASDFSGAVRNTEEPSSKNAVEGTPAAAAETAAPEINSATFGDYTLSAPSDWVFDTEEEHVLQNDSRYKAHVLYAYKGRKSKTSPYIALSSFEIVGVGGGETSRRTHTKTRSSETTRTMLSTMNMRTRLSRLMKLSGTGLVL